MIEKNRQLGEEPNNVVIPELKLAFIIIPKCGNKSIKTMIVDQMGYGDTREHLWGLKYAYLSNIPKDYLKIALVRNPYGRIVSLYENKINGRSDLKRKQLKKHGFKPNMSFRDYVYTIKDLPSDYGDALDVHLKSQYYFLTVNDQVAVGKTIKHEKLPEAWHDASTACLFRCGIMLPELPHLHKSGKKDVKSYYTDDLAEIVYNRYKKDFKLLDYDEQL